MKVPFQVHQIRQAVIPRIKQLRVFFVLQFLLNLKYCVRVFGMYTQLGDVEPSCRKMTIAHKLTKASDLLVCLDKQKTCMEQRIEKACEAICKVEQRIDKMESEVERAAEEKMSREMRQKLWDEIALLRKEKKNAEKHLDCYRKKLRMKVKKFKKLSQQLR